MLPLREGDRIEIEVTGRDATRALYESFEASKPNVFAILIDEAVGGVFGVGAGRSTNCGIPWLLGNDKLRSIPRDLLVQGRAWVDFLNLLYPHLENFVHSENQTSIRWLIALGFDVHSELYTLPNGHSFRRFTRDV